MAVGSFFFLQPQLPKTAQNSPELHFRFINSFIQPSLVGSLLLSKKSSNLSGKESSQVNAIESDAQICILTKYRLISISGQF
jgi:hypothetical protein